MDLDDYSFAIKFQLNSDKGYFRRDYFISFAYGQWKYRFCFQGRIKIFCSTYVIICCTVLKDLNNRARGQYHSLLRSENKIITMF